MELINALQVLFLLSVGWYFQLLLLVLLHWFCKTLVVEFALCALSCMYSCVMYPVLYRTNAYIFSCDAG